ncbi:MAG TPA: EF-Tu/IF-2/RF-3 family GTPase [Nitrospiria bacterium]|jgi:hypothetical protein|nr:EF-Tu/IF-2/RF-3 family GTPase [Nitrospiria bacterium]
MKKKVKKKAKKPVKKKTAAKKTIKKKTVKKAVAKKHPVKKKRAAKKPTPKKAMMKRAAPKPSARPMAKAPSVEAPAGGKPVGKVIHYYTLLSVAIVELIQGTLRVGDTIHLKGHTTNFKQTVESMEIEHQRVTEAAPGQSFGIKVREHARENDIVYKVAS